MSCVNEPFHDIRKKNTFHTRVIYLGRFKLLYLDPYYFSQHCFSAMKHFEMMMNTKLTILLTLDNKKGQTC